jgi:hypothetical protein
MADPQSLVAQVVFDNEGSGRMIDVQARMDPLVIHVRRLKGSILLAHRTRITYQKKRYMSIRN